MKKNEFVIRKTGNTMIDNAIGDAVNNYLNVKEDEENKGREDNKMIYEDADGRVFKDQASAEAFAKRNGIQNPLILDYVPRYITVDETMQILGVSRQRISQLIGVGRLIARNGKGINKNTVMIQKKVSKSGRPFNSFKKKW